MLKFTYIKIGVVKMYKKHIFVKFYAAMLLFVAGSLSAGTLPDNIEFGTKLNLFTAKASIPSGFLADYKTTYLKLDIDFAYNITEDLSFNFLPYVWASYYADREDKNQTKARIWQAYLKYGIGNFDFNLGRFDFVDKALSPFIYFGDNLPKDLALPTSLDGIKHNFTGKYINYTLLLAQEAQIDTNAKAKLAGAKITGKPLSWLNLSTFYFRQNKKYIRDGINRESSLSVYGGGIDLFFNENSGFRFYGAKNGGENKRIGPVITQKVPYKGYAFNCELYFRNLYKAGSLDNKLGFYKFSEKDKFYTFPSKLETGIIYGGMNYNNNLPASPQIIYAVLDFNFKKYPFLYTGAGLFVYSSGKENANNHNYYAQEINLNAQVKFDTWGLKLSGGLFEGEALFLGGTTTDKQKIKKLQAKFFYKFTL